MKKNKAIHNEDKLLWGASKKLSKKGQDQIWKEISLGRMFSKENLPLKNNTTTLSEHKKIRFAQKQWLAVDCTLYKLFDKLDENGDNPLMAGMEGFEPPNGGTRTRCLTTWRHPNGKHNCTIEK